ncbi:hypothetical protein [Candidatus Methanocrinis natronophilus]|uniref:Uncharacterized protein n=1 Tax=Candidatus Methanocrinis natronophilus TaxID=3033396 RepID=A0ABT5X6R1_9EURY|nr:hypothetical protein [Candidatus Methanocrinis natronophilus]MDF0590385.1 hypothetical protein [Candidatus Methanocrinis natronophilus]
MPSAASNKALIRSLLSAVGMEKNSTMRYVMEGRTRESSEKTEPQMRG